MVTFSVRLKVKVERTSSEVYRSRHSAPSHDHPISTPGTPRPDTSALYDREDQDDPN